MAISLRVRFVRSDERYMTRMLHPICLFHLAYQTLNTRTDTIVLVNPPSRQTTDQMPLLNHERTEDLNIDLPQHCECR